MQNLNWVAVVLTVTDSCCSLPLSRPSGSSGAYWHLFIFFIFPTSQVFPLNSIVQLIFSGYWLIRLVLWLFLLNTAVVCLTFLNLFVCSLLKDWLLVMLTLTNKLLSLDFYRTVYSLNLVNLFLSNVLWLLFQNWPTVNFLNFHRLMPAWSFRSLTRLLWVYV